VIQKLQWEIPIPEPTDTLQDWWSSRRVCLLIEASEGSLMLSLFSQFGPSGRMKNRNAWTFNGRKKQRLTPTDRKRVGVGVNTHYRRG
jgi:hypothetical protein